MHDLFCERTISLLLSQEVLLFQRKPEVLFILISDSPTVVFAVTDFPTSSILPYLEMIVFPNRMTINTTFRSSRPCFCLRMTGAEYVMFQVTHPRYRDDHPSCAAGHRGLFRLPQELRFDRGVVCVTISILAIVTRLA